jgi:hypothetical protein
MIAPTIESLLRRVEQLEAQIRDMVLGDNAGAPASTAPCAECGQDDTAADSTGSGAEDLPGVGWTFPTTKDARNVLAEINARNARLRRKT